MPDTFAFQLVKTSGVSVAGQCELIFLQVIIVSLISPIFLKSSGYLRSVISPVYERERELWSLEWVGGVVVVLEVLSFSVPHSV